MGDRDTCYTLTATPASWVCGRAGEQWSVAHLQVDRLPRELCCLRGDEQSMIVEQRVWATQVLQELWRREWRSRGLTIF